MIYLSDMHIHTDTHTRMYINMGGYINYYPPRFLYMQQFMEENGLKRLRQSVDKSCRHPHDPNDLSKCL